MDAFRFDRLTRSLTTAGSRRRALGGLLLGSLGLLGWQDQEEAIAHDLKDKCKKKSGEAKKKCLKKAKKHAAQHAAEPPSPSPLTCPSGQRPCRGACLSTLICCDDSDCAGGRTCQSGTCDCPADKPLICPGTTVCAECCTVAHCSDLAPVFPGLGLACQNGQCVCTISDTHLCRLSSSGARYCGSCCATSECTGGKECLSINDAPFHCVCDQDGIDCAGTCIPPHCGQAACGAHCTTSGVCCGPLTCQQDSPASRSCLPVP